MEVLFYCASCKKYQAEVIEIKGRVPEDFVQEHYWQPRPGQMWVKKLCKNCHTKFETPLG